MKNFYTVLNFIAILFFTSCASSYKKYLKNYQQFPNDSVPNYANLNYWAANPLKYSLSDSTPRFLKNLPKDSMVDVFFIHPTTYTNDDFNNQWNASINDAELNAKTDYSSILYQASVFNGVGKIYAPRYRQAHLQAFFTADKLSALKAFNLAYEDVKSAFEFYLTHYNYNKPIIIAAHSQGTLHAARLVKDFFENKPLQKKLVIAYFIGLPNPKGFFKNIQPCKDSSSTGCYVGWRTLKKGFIPDYVLKENGTSTCTNPLVWNNDLQFASKNLHQGAILKNFNKLHKHIVNAQVNSSGVLWTMKPKFFGNFLIRKPNYHVGDINLYYMNIRNNLYLRVKEYFKNYNKIEK